MNIKKYITIGAIALSSILGTYCTQKTPIINNEQIEVIDSTIDSTIDSESIDGSGLDRPVTITNKNYVTKNANKDYRTLDNKLTELDDKADKYKRWLKTTQKVQELLEKRGKVEAEAISLQDNAKKSKIVKSLEELENVSDETYVVFEGEYGNLFPTSTLESVGKQNSTLDAKARGYVSATRRLNANIEGKVTGKITESGQIYTMPERRFKGMLLDKNAMPVLLSDMQKGHELAEEYNRLSAEISALLDAYSSELDNLDDLIVYAQNMNVYGAKEGTNTLTELLGLETKGIMFYNSETDSLVFVKYDSNIFGDLETAEDFRRHGLLRIFGMKEKAEQLEQLVEKYGLKNNPRNQFEDLKQQLDEKGTKYNTLPFMLKMSMMSNNGDQKITVTGIKKTIYDMPGIEVISAKIGNRTYNLVTK